MVLDLDARGGKSARTAVTFDSESRALRVRGFHKAIPWSCRISEEAQEGLTLAFSSPIVREYLAMHVALLPALQRLLVDRRIALVGGASFETGDGATILAGLTGSGKTSLLLGARERGARILGDEFVGLGGDGEVTPVVRVIALRRATLALAPGLHSRLSLKRRLALRAAELTARVTRGRMQPLIHISPLELGAPPPSGERAPLRRFFWLEPELAVGGAAGCEPMGARDAVEKLIIAQAVHNLAFGDLGAFVDAARSGCAGPDSAQRWRETIETGLRGVACYRITSPAGRPVPPEVLDHVLGQS